VLMPAATMYFRQVGSWHQVPMSCTTSATQPAGTVVLCACGRKGFTPCLLKKKPCMAGCQHFLLVPLIAHQRAPLQGLFFFSFTEYNIRQL
jgi:hypothetical protein